MFPEHLKREIKFLLEDKREIWPWPSPADGGDDYIKQRACLFQGNWSRWKEDKEKVENSKNEWTIYNPIVPQTSSTEDQFSLPSSHHSSDMEEEEDDEV